MDLSNIDVSKLTRDELLVLQAVLENERHKVGVAIEALTNALYPPYRPAVSRRRDRRSKKPKCS